MSLTPEDEAELRDTRSFDDAWMDANEAGRKRLEARVAELESRLAECVRVMGRFGAWAKTINFDTGLNTPVWLAMYAERLGELEQAYKLVTFVENIHPEERV